MGEVARHGDGHQRLGVPVSGGLEWPTTGDSPTRGSGARMVGEDLAGPASHPGGTSGSGALPE